MYNESFVFLCQAFTIEDNLRFKFMISLIFPGTYPGALSSLRTTRQITPCLSAPPLTTSANTFPTTYARILPAVSSASLWPSLPTFKSQAVVMTVSPLVSVSGLTVLTSTEPRLLQSKVCNFCCRSVVSVCCIGCS